MKKIIFILAVLSSFLLFNNVYAASNNTISFDGTRFYAIRKDNSLWVWQSEDEEPEKLMDNVVGINQNCIIKDDATLWYYDEIPIKLSDDVYKASAYSSYVLFIKNDKTLWYIDLNVNAPQYVPIKLMNNVYDAQLGSEHCIILKTDGSVWGFGSNTYGQLGVNNDFIYKEQPIKILDNMQDIFTGETSSFAIDENDILYRWGSNYGNAVGIKETEIQDIPIKYVKDAKSVNSHWGFNLILKQDNTLWIYGDSEFEKFGYTCYPTGINFTNFPYKICDDVNCVSEWNTDQNHKTLILKNNGDLFEFELIEGKQRHTPQYKIEKINSNIKLSIIENNKKPKKFSDVSDQTEEMQTAINALFKAGIVEGTGETEFSPDKPITRAEIAALLLWISAKTDIEDNGGFTDVTEDKWYYHTAGTSKKHGIVLGFEDNTFRGDEPVSKLQMVSLTSRVLRNESVFVDEEVNSKAYANIPDWAVEDIALAEQEGLISAEKDLISLNEDMTRGEAAVILYRLYNKI